MASAAGGTARGFRALRPRDELRWRGLSLRARLLALAMVLAALALVLSDTIVVGSLRSSMLHRTDQQLHSFAKPLSTRNLRVSHRLRSGARRSLPSQYYVAYLTPGGELVQRPFAPVRAGDPQPVLPPLDTEAVQAHGGRPFTVPSDRGGHDWRVIALPVVPPATTALGGGNGVRAAPSSGQLTTAAQVSRLNDSVVVATSLADVDNTVSRLRTSCLFLGIAVLGGLGLAGWFAMRAGLKPLRRIEQTAVAIAAGDLSRRVPDQPPRTEMGRLSAALNGMLAQIEAGFAARAESERRMRRFVGDASHELRTPLAGIRGFAELYRMGALHESDDVARTMARIESEAVRMGGLVEDLLQLARLDEQRPLRAAPVDLLVLAADALLDVRGLDASRKVTLTGPGGLGPGRKAVVQGDEARLRQVLANLIGNAIAHTPAGTPIRLGVGVAVGRAMLEVADRGPGMTAEESRRVFERFYRVDVSRSRGAGGGAGLGLAIVAAIVQAHHGLVEVDTQPGLGATFRVVLPLAPPRALPPARPDGPPQRGE